MWVWEKSILDTVSAVHEGRHGQNRNITQKLSFRNFPTFALELEQNSLPFRKTLEPLET